MSYVVGGVCFFLSSIVGVVGGATTVVPEESVYVGGWGRWTYVYEPELLPIPAEATIEHAHGIHVEDVTNAIVITYQDAADPSKCLLRWTPPYDQGAEFLGPGAALCQGTPHGLMASVEGNHTFLYHANNEQALHKTTTDGDLIWSVHGPPTNTVSGNNRLRRNKKKITEAYAPTWLALEPGSPFVFLADGYGSNQIYVLNKSNGNFVADNVSVGGGPGTQHGKFQTCHGMNNWSTGTMVVCDRENHRFEYFAVNPNDPSQFEYLYTESFLPYLVRPCMIRSRTVKLDGPEEEERQTISIVAALEGSVGILVEGEGEGAHGRRNQLVSFLNITEVLGEDYGFLHPHDVHLLRNGDFVLVTWNPGRVGYFRLTKNMADQLSYLGRRRGP